jgi:hypothetical protein
MPVSKNFGEPTENYGYTDPGSVYSVAGSGDTAGDENGIGGTLWGVNLSYALNAPVFFPASGNRNNNGNLNNVGSNGNYWSSSAYLGTRAYNLNFYSSYVDPNNSYYERANGMSGRCVRE